MKANQVTEKKMGRQIGKQMGKRIFTLKELAQRDFALAPKTFSKDTSNRVSLAHIQEDLLDEEQTQLDSLFSEMAKTLLMDNDGGNHSAETEKPAE